MKTVQRVPRSTGDEAERAWREKSWTESPRAWAKVSMKEPQPEEQASLSMMASMTPSWTKRLFMSWPPMSRTKVTSGAKN